MTSVATPPVDPREDRLFRAIKARADYLAKPVVGYDGAPALPGLDEQESARRAVSHLRPFLQANPEAKQSWKDYIDGKVDMPPKGWVPDYSSPEDVRQFRAEGMARARSENPWLAAGTDALNTVGSLGEGFTQGVVDSFSGVGNIVASGLESMGVVPPGTMIPRVDVKASLRAFALNHVPWLKEQGKTFTTDEARRELDATKDTANIGVKLASGAASGIGSMYSMIGTGGAGVLGKVSQATSAPFRAAMKLGDGIGKTLGTLTGKVALAQSAGAVLGSAAGIAADKAIKAGTTQDAATGQERKTTMGERAGQAGVGAAEGALFGLLGEVGKAAFRSMFKSPLSKLGVDEKNAVTTLSEWAKQNHLFQVGRETTEAYSKRLLNAYAEAGFPGAPRMYGRQILGRAMQGGIEGLGFSALDEKFHRDLFDGAFQGDMRALERAMVSYGSNVFATMAMHGPLKDIPRGQRRMDFTPTGEAPKPQEPVKAQEPSAPQQPAPKPDLPQGGALEAGKSTMEGEPTPTTINPGTLDVGRQPKIDTATGTILGGQPSLQRFGWIRDVPAPSDNPVVGFDPSVTEAEKASIPREPETMTLPGTKMGFEVDGDVARPTKALREALGVPSELPVTELTQAIEGASVMSALVAKEQLPGTVISADGIVAVPDGDGVMRTVRLGEVLESPLSPTPTWFSAESFPARGKDPIPQEQAQVVEILTDIVNNRQDLPEHTRAMLSKAADVMDTVSLHSDEAVAETMGVVADLVPIIAQGTPEQAAKAVQALGESLTVKHPEIALRDMAGPQDPVQKAPPRGDDNPDGYGPAQVGMGVPIPREAGDIARVGGKGALEGASKAWSAYQASKTKRAEEVTNPTIGKIGREAASQERVYDARYNKAGVGDMLRLSTKARKELEQVVTDKDGYQTTAYVVNRDAGAKEHFGAGPKLSEKARRGVELGDAIQLETGRVAEENKVEFLNAGEDGPQRFTTNERRKRHIRMATPEWIHAMDVQKGEVWDAMVRFHEINGGWTPERTAKHYNDVRTAMRRDATEYLRVHRSLPTRVPTKDGMVKIFEDTPVEHSVRLARTSSHVMSVKNTLARYPVEPKPGDRDYKGNVEGSELPTDVQAQLSRVATDYGDAAADTVADMFRPLMGMSNNGRNAWMGEPGTAYNKVARVIVDLVNLAKVSKLPLSFVKNMFEAAADAPFLTRQALMHGYGKVFQDFMGGKVNAVYRDLVSEGWVKDSAESTPLQGMDAVESFSLNLERAKSLILTPVTISQSVNEMVKAYAARERLQAMREGNGTTADLNALKLLEFDAETAMRMVDGKGTDLEYQQYKTAIIGALSGGKSLHGVFRSSMADNRGFNALVWYNSYFQTRARAMTALGSRVAEARGTEKVEASAQLFRMAAFTALSGLLGELASKFLKGEAGDYVRESTKDLGSASEATLKLLAGGLLGGVGTPVSETLGKLTSGESTEDVLGGSIARAIPLLGVVGDFTDLVRSTVLGANVPGYEGKSFAGKVSKYLQEFTPLASTLHRGLFGLSALAITEHDPALDAANRSLWRWMADNPDYAKGKFVSKEASAEFRSAMRKVVDRVMSGDTWTDEQLSDALLEAEMAAQDEADKAGEPVTIREIRNRVAKSLRARKVIPPKLPEAVQSSLEDHLGADHYQTLQDYDRVLEAMARHVSPPRRF